MSEKKDSAELKAAIMAHRNAELGRLAKEDLGFRAFGSDPTTMYTSGPLRAAAWSGWCAALGEWEWAQNARDNAFRYEAHRPPIFPTETWRRDIPYPRDWELIAVSATHNLWTTRPLRLWTFLRLWGRERVEAGVNRLRWWWLALRRVSREDRFARDRWRMRARRERLTKKADEMEAAREQA